MTGLLVSYAGTAVSPETELWYCLPGTAVQNRPEYSSIKLEEYRKLFNCPTQRQSFDDICKAAAKISLETTGIKIKELKDSLIFPCIGQLEITEGSLNFVVIYSVGENIVIADPARGLRQIPNDIFNKIFTGNVLLFRVKT